MAQDLAGAFGHRGALGAAHAFDQVSTGQTRRERPALGAAPHPWLVLGLAIALGAGILAVVALSPVRFAYPASSSRVALETGVALATLLSTYILLGQLRPGWPTDRLYLAAALVTIAATNLLLAAVHVIEPGTVPRVALHSGALAGATLLALAAFVPSRGSRRPRATTVGLLATWAAVVAASYVLSRLALGGGQPALERPPDVIGLHLVGAALFGLAAIGFARRSRRTGEELLSWLSVGAMLIAFARLAYLLFPPPADWVHVGDVLRALFCLVVLLGATRWVREYWRGLAATAVADERRRIARELHDGVTQELALIRRRAPALASPPQAALVEEITAAAKRAQDEARKAIDVLSRPGEEPLDRALARAARQATAGTGVAVSLNLARGVDVEPEVRENLVRIAREAIVNAARHGDAATIHVELDRGHPLRMRVVDDGAGFAPGSGAAAGSFGLVSMRERADAIGADLTLHSRPGTGTEIRVRLP
jgi:signal transduction histidine kinase